LLTFEIVRYTNILVQWFMLLSSEEIFGIAPKCETKLLIPKQKLEIQISLTSGWQQDARWAVN